jgi:hypothetical protein
MSASVSELVRLHRVINPDRLVAERAKEFQKWTPDAIEVEFGNDAQGTSSRGYCSRSELYSCVAPNLGKSYAGKIEESTLGQLLMNANDPAVVFDFQKLAALFAKQIVPSQIAMRRELVLFNPAKLTFFGRP